MNTDDTHLSASVLPAWRDHGRCGRSGHDWRSARAAGPAERSGSVTGPQRLPRDLGWLVAGGDRLVGLDGWIGQAPDTGRDVAHLLLHPLGDGRAAQMRTVAGVLGLHRGDGPALVDVPPDTTLAHLDGTAVTLRYGDDALLTRPVTVEWADTARAAGWIILSAGVDGIVIPAGGGDRLDRYLTRPQRIWLGRIRLLVG